MSQATERLASYGRRSYARNGWRWTILSIQAVDNRLVIEAQAQELGSAGRTFLWRKDQPEPHEWLEVINPRTLVQDGDEPDPFSPTGRRLRFREDHIEALKIELDRFLARRLNA